MSALGVEHGGAAPGLGLLEIGAQPALAFRVPALDASGEIGDELLQCGAQRVINTLGVDVGARRHEMRRDAKRRAGFEPPLDEHSRLVDLERGAQRFELAGDQRGEGGRRLVKAMLDVKFHDAASLASPARFDYAAMSNASFAFMESTKHDYEWLNYHHLRYFYAVTREGSISRAAEKLGTSQSALCAQVKQLEAALGEPLYRRAGRSIVLTDFGQLIRGYAEEVFAIGREILSTAKGAPGPRALRLSIGIVDSFPKLLTLDVLRPVFSHEPQIHVACHEGKLEDLLAQLAAHRLDALLADEPPPSSAKIKTFDHPLGSSGITFCADPRLARRLTGRFPRNLHRAPMLLPLPHTALRRELEKWFRATRIEPVVVGEFEDAALAKIVATEGVGVITVPTLVASEAIERYGFTALGRTQACRFELHLITAERRIEHPAVSLMASSGKRGHRRRG